MVGTVISWCALLRTRDNRIPSHLRPKGAWERATALSSLTGISDASYIKTMASNAARVAAETEAFASVRSHAKLPLFMVGVYFGLGVLAYSPSFNVGTLLVTALRNPIEALRQHAPREKSTQDLADRLVAKGLRFTATKISKEQGKLKRRTAELDDRERMLASNWSLKRG